MRTMAADEGIPATRIRNVSAVVEERCPICQQPISRHLLGQQTVIADWPAGQLEVRMLVYCGRP